MQREKEEEREREKERESEMAVSGSLCHSVFLCWQLSLMRAKGEESRGLGGKQHLGSEVGRRGAKLVQSGCTVSSNRDAVPANCCGRGTDVQPERERKRARGGEY